MASRPGFFVPISLERLFVHDPDDPHPIGPEELREGFYAFQRQLEDWLNDIPPLVASGDFWEVDRFGDLHPIVDPDSFSVTTAGTITLTSTFGGVGVSIELEAPSAGGTISLDSYDNVGMTSSHEQAFVQAKKAITIDSETGDITLDAEAGLILIDAATDVFATPDRDLVLGGAATDQVDIRTTASAPTDGRMQTGSIVFYLDEVGNNLKVRAKYSNGTTFKTATVALV